MNEFSELLCPICEEPLNEEDLKTSLICPHCKKNLKKPEFLNFLEYLIIQGIVDNIDFFDETLYGSDFMKYETNEFDDLGGVATTDDDTDSSEFLDKNVMQIEEEYIKDMQEDNAIEDYSKFNPNSQEDDNNE